MCAVTLSFTLVVHVACFIVLLFTAEERKHFKTWQNKEKKILFSSGTPTQSSILAPVGLVLNLEKVKGTHFALREGQALSRQVHREGSLLSKSDPMTHGGTVKKRKKRNICLPNRGC